MATGMSNSSASAKYLSTPGSLGEVPPYCKPISPITFIPPVVKSLRNSSNGTRSSPFSKSVPGITRFGAAFFHFCKYILHVLALRRGIEFRTALLLHPARLLPRVGFGVGRRKFGSVWAHRAHGGAIVVVHGVVVHINDRRNVRTCVLRAGHAGTSHEKKGRHNPGHAPLDQVQHHFSPRSFDVRPSKGKAYPRSFGTKVPR